MKITTINLENIHVSDYAVKMTFILALCSETLHTSVYLRLAVHCSVTVWYSVSDKDRK